MQRKSIADGYGVALIQYADFHDESIGYLIGEALDDEEKIIPLKDRKFKKRLLDFRNYLFDSSLSFSSVKTFYMHFLN